MKCIEYRLIDDLNELNLAPVRSRCEECSEGVIFDIFSCCQVYIFLFFGFSLRIESRSCRCFATGSGEWVDADPAACDREEDLDELIETVDTTEIEIKDEEVFPPVRWSRLCFYGKVFSEKNINIYIK